MTSSPDPASRFGFPLGEELTRELEATIEQIRRDPSDKAHVTALVKLVLKMTDAGLREFYLRPLEQAKTGAIGLGTARVGISAAKRGIAVVVNKLLGGMKPAQLESIADSMEGFWIRREAPEETP